MSMILFLHARLPMTIAPVLEMLIRALNDDGYDDDDADDIHNDSEQDRFPFVAQVGQNVK
jgi:hypothetical protein